MLLMFSLSSSTLAVLVADWKSFKYNLLWTFFFFRSYFFLSGFSQSEEVQLPSIPKCLSLVLGRLDLLLGLSQSDDVEYPSVRDLSLFLFLLCPFLPTVLPLLPVTMGDLDLLSSNNGCKELVTYFLKKKTWKVIINLHMTHIIITNGTKLHCKIKIDNNND